MNEISDLAPLNVSRNPGERTLIRRRALRALFPIGISSATLQIVLNELPGDPFWRDEIAEWASSEKLKRNEPSVEPAVYHGITISGYLARRWTEARVGVMIEALGTHRTYKDICDELADLQGEPINPDQVAGFSYTHLRHIKRPTDLIQHIAKKRWARTPEQRSYTQSRIDELREKRESDAVMRAKTVAEIDLAAERRMAVRASRLSQKAKVDVRQKRAAAQALIAIPEPKTLIPMATKVAPPQGFSMSAMRTQAPPPVVAPLLALAPTVTHESRPLDNADATPRARQSGVKMPPASIERARVLAMLTQPILPASRCQTVTDQGVHGFGITFCDAPSSPGKSYCPACCARYYVRAPRRQPSVN